MIVEDAEISDEFSENPLKPNQSSITAKPTKFSMASPSKTKQSIPKISWLPQKDLAQASSNENFNNTASTAYSFSTYLSAQSQRSQRSQPYSQMAEGDELLSSPMKRPEDFLGDIDETSGDSKHATISKPVASKILEFKLPKTLEQELADFQPDNDPCGIDSETINYLISLEREYAPDSEYLATSQSHINAEMRAILIDWMMEVCSDYGLKRETFHFATNYVDRYLNSVPGVAKKELQLVGASALFIAAKNEEVRLPKVKDFAKSCDGAYTAEQILEFEIKMLKALNWLLTPPTLNNWTQWYLNQWDLFIERVVTCGITDFYGPSREMVFFRKQNDVSYYRFREINQLLDTCMLDIRYLKYNQRALLAAFMYLTIGLHSGVFDQNEICERVFNDDRLLKKKSSYNELFGDFLEYCFAMQLEDILPAVQFASKFLILPLNFELPRVLKIKKKEGTLKGHFEEFLSYQTYHPKSLEFIKQLIKSNK